MRGMAVWVLVDKRQAGWTPIEQREDVGRSGQTRRMKFGAKVRQEGQAAAIPKQPPHN